MSVTVTPTARVRRTVSEIPGFVWCADCGEPHETYEGKVSTRHVAFEDMACLSSHPDVLIVDRLPESWERDYSAEYVYERVARHKNRAGFDVVTRYRLVPHEIDLVDGVHAPLFTTGVVL